MQKFDCQFWNDIIILKSIIRKLNRNNLPNETSGHGQQQADHNDNGFHHLLRSSHSRMIYNYTNNVRDIRNESQLTITLKISDQIGSNNYTN
jgi:hypothetical protein